MEYHQDRFIDCSVMIFKDETLVAVFPANRDGDKVFSHQGLTYGSLVLSKDVKFKHVVGCFKTLLMHFESEGVKDIYVKLVPEIYNAYPSNEAEFLMYKLEAELYRKDIISAIDLASPRLKLSKDRRDGIKRGIKNSLIVREVDTFDEFWNNILVPNLNQKHNVQPVHSLEEITLLKQRFPKNIRQFNVYKDDTIVAGTTVFETELVAHSQYISANQDKNNLGSLDFLHDYIINSVFKEKRYFDFGTSHERDGTINEGLMYWKEGFGARSYTQDFYRLETSKHHKLNTVFT
ncbi:GNAT family N-acetyltransferase [Winogradskyella sp. 3972H.M.0a.05]|uniref:GNAT family N-acetyltransferase n=1 Tax=Winogradskyella sp. 3972H.M.0a.05 TaxID=2950277 RepID=UPI00339AD435